MKTGVRREADHPPGASSPPRRLAGDQPVELGVAGHPHPVQRRAERQRPLGLLVLAHQEADRWLASGLPNSAKQRPVAPELPGERRPLVSTIRAPAVRGAMRSARSRRTRAPAGRGAAPAPPAGWPPAGPRGRRPPRRPGRLRSLRHRVAGVGQGRDDDAAARAARLQLLGSSAGATAGRRPWRRAARCAASRSRGRARPCRGRTAARPVTQLGVRQQHGSPTTKSSDSRDGVEEVHRGGPSTRSPRGS